MSRIARHLVSLSVVVAVLSALPAYAQQSAKRQARAAKRGQQASARAFQFPKEITLTEEQQTKLKALQQEYGPKLDAANKKLDEVLTAEQRAARNETAKANRDAKKTGREARDAINASLKLTPEQKTKYDAAQKEVQELRKVVEQKKSELLTAEQRAQLPKRRTAKRTK